MTKTFSKESLASYSIFVAYIQPIYEAIMTLAKISPTSKFDHPEKTLQFGWNVFSFILKKTLIYGFIFIALAIVGEVFLIKRFPRIAFGFALGFFASLGNLYCLAKGVSAFLLEEDSLWMFFLALLGFVALALLSFIMSQIWPKTLLAMACGFAAPIVCGAFYVRALGKHEA